MRHGRIALLCVCALLLGFAGGIRLLHPIVAGVWYPADPEALRQSVEKCVKEATSAPIRDPEGRCVALIVPHAPYATFGTVAGAAFKRIERGQYDRVIVLAPAHYTQFPGCSIPSAQAYRTPLGDIPLDGPAIRVLDRSPLIDVRSVSYGKTIPPALAGQAKKHQKKHNKKNKGKQTAAFMDSFTQRAQLHEKEYTIEVVLPFLQVQLGEFKLIPMLVGDFKEYNGHIDEGGIADVAEALRAFVDDRTLIVVSSDFTHFGNNFGYRPFEENILEGIDLLDRQAFSLILGHDFKGFQAYLEETHNTICGRNAISVLLKLLPKRAQGVLLSYEVSARRSGDTTRSISYASIAFIEPAAVARP